MDSQMLQPLQGTIQHYAWGKKGRFSFIANLLSNSVVEDDKNYAEYWMGTHPNGPSRILGSSETLNEYLARNPSLLGTHEKGSLRFLFKVLSVGTALSIQSHPTKEQAKILHAKDRTNYPDENHKPEMAIALTDFELLCGFQTHHRIISNIKAHRELLELVGEPLLDGLASTDSNPVKGTKALREIFTQVWTNSAEKVAYVVTKIVERLKNKSDLAPVDELLLRLHAQFPGDIGVLAPFFLNFFTLRPGQATFLGPNEPHAYLSGDCIECMALSDNTIRAGLTPKFKDVQTLCASLTYHMYPPPIFEPTILSDGTVEYRPPVEEFAVHKIGSSVLVLAPLEAASILICVGGTAKFGAQNNGEFYEVGNKSMSPLFLPKGFTTSIVEASDDFLAFRAFTPLPSK